MPDDQDVLNRVQEACRILGVEPPEKLYRRIEIVIDRHLNADIKFQWHVGWSANAGDGGFIGLPDVSKSQPDSEQASASPSSAEAG